MWGIELISNLFKFLYSDYYILSILFCIWTIDFGKYDEMNWMNWIVNGDEIFSNVHVIYYYIMHLDLVIAPLP